MDEYLEIEVTIKSTTERSLKVIGSKYKYTNNYQASLYHDFFTIPKSQIRGIRDISDDRQAILLPKWLIQNEGLDKFIVSNGSFQEVDINNTGESLKAEKLSCIDEIDRWPDEVSRLNIINKREVFDAAQSLWIERMLKENKLLIHPEVANQLVKQGFIANDLQMKMIWASVLASADGSDSKERFRVIKDRLIKKYGRDWWEDTYRRVKPAYAARERIKKIHKSNGPAMRVLIRKTHLFSDVHSGEVKAALKMIPFK